jgi:hypothetical protein
MTLVLNPTGITLHNDLGGPADVATIVGAAPQWADGQDSTYAGLAWSTNAGSGGNNDFADATIFASALAPSAVEDVVIHVRIRVDPHADSTDATLGVDLPGMSTDLGTETIIGSGPLPLDGTMHSYDLSVTDWLTPLVGAPAAAQHVLDIATWLAGGNRQMTMYIAGSYGASPPGTARVSEFSISLATDPSLDSDSDTLTDDEEITLGTDPFDPDTDDDTLTDAEEVTLGTDPLDPDTDADSFTDAEEVLLGSDPLDPSDPVPYAGPTRLNEFQFEILSSEDADSGFIFGIGAEVSVGSDGFDPGENEWITQDTVNERRGSTAFGRDVLGAKTWVWESHVNRTTVPQALDTLDRFSAAWAPEELVLVPGEQTALRYSIGGRERRIFGRPRRYSAPPSNRILGGYVPVTHDFKLVDSRTYDDVESSALITYSSTIERGGFTLPAVFPLITSANIGSGVGAINVGGNARTYPIIRFNGPWTNPAIVTPDWELSWSGGIAAGDWVEIDLRPWKLTVLNRSGASVVGGLGKRIFLEDCFLRPGTQPQIALDGIATSGGASCSIRWRNAWTSI